LTRNYGVDDHAGRAGVLAEGCAREKKEKKKEHVRPI